MSELTLKVCFKLKIAAVAAVRAFSLLRLIPDFRGKASPVNKIRCSLRRGMIYCAGFQ